MYLGWYAKVLAWIHYSEKYLNVLYYAQTVIGKKQLGKLFILSLFLPFSLAAQDVAVRYQAQVIGSRGLPLANQSVAVCTQPAVTTTQPCSPLATLGTSTSTTSGGANPLTTDVNGNFFFYATPGKYTIQIYGPQVGTPFVQPDTDINSGPFGATTITTLTITGALNANGGGALNGNFTGPTNTQQLNGCQYVNANQTFAQALATVSNPGCIQVSPGTYTVAASATVPAGVSLSHSKGGILSIATGQTLTVNGPFQAGAQQAFITQATGSPVAITAASESTSGSAVAITAAAEVGNRVTITSTLNPGQYSTVIISGVTPAGYNGSYTVIDSSASSFTYFNTTTGLGAGSVFGTAQVSTNTVTFTSTLSAVVGMPVFISGVTPANYNGTFLVLTTNPGVSFTVWNPIAGLTTGTAFGTVTMGGAVQFGPIGEATSRPEWFGAIADGSGTPIVGTDNFSAFLMAQAALPVFTLINQGTKLLQNGQLARAGKMQLSTGYYVISQTIQPSLFTTYDCPSYEGCSIVLKSGIATSGVEYWTAIVYPQNGQNSNSAFGSQFRNIKFEGNGGLLWGTNVMSSGLQFAGVQGSSLGIMEIENYGQRGLWLAPNGSGPNSGANGPNDIWVNNITVGPGIQLDASTSFFASIRAEIINQNSTYVDIDGDPNAGILFGSALSNGASNLDAGFIGAEFDGLPFKFWSGAAINILNLTAQANTGGQPTMAIISHSATSITLGSMFTFGSSPNVFTNFVVDRTTTPTTTVPATNTFGCSTPPCSFPTLTGYSNGGVSPINSLQFPELSAAPPNIQKAAFDGCYGDSVLHVLKCTYNNGTFFQIAQVIRATSAAFATATTAGTCVQNTTAVTGATTGMAVTVSPVSTPGVGAQWSAFVSSAGNVTINECAVATSAGGTIAFNIAVTP
jgi:hypothetical protein